MDIADLQSRLAALEHLLPSQREWLERLLFQLAFNEVHYVEAVGPAGSGKTTLALALAELCSERFNIALISKSVSASELSQQLMQQWFGLPAQAGVPLSDGAITPEDILRIQGPAAVHRDHQAQGAIAQRDHGARAVGKVATAAASDSGGLARHRAGAAAARAVWQPCGRARQQHRAGPDRLAQGQAGRPQDCLHR